MKEMKGRRMERLVVLPFAGGCVSNSSVDIIQRNTKRSNLRADFLPAMSKEDEKALSSGGNMKSSFRSLAVPRPNISSSLHRLVKGFSQLFAYEDEVQNADMDMEIGSPTDVKHVTHIGWDASSDTNPLEGWESLINPDIFSVPSVSLRQ